MIWVGVIVGGALGLLFGWLADPPEVRARRVADREARS